MNKFLTITSIILFFSIMLLTSCDGGSSGSGGGGRTYIKQIGGGSNVDVSSLNGNNLYMLLSNIPSSKLESNSAPSTVSNWTLSTSSLFSMAPSVYNNSNLQKNNQKVLSKEYNQLDVDVIMRNKENELLSAKLIQFNENINSRFSAAPSSISLGTVWNGVTIAITGNSINTTCQKISNHAYFFIDNRDISSMASYLDAYAINFDAIYDINHSKFGSENDVDGNGKVIIVFSRDLINYSANLLGYFSSGDKYPVALVPSSNEGDIFYMTTSSSFQGAVINGTLAHEFQHMIYFDEHYDRGVTYTYSWLNEALSQAAEYYNGHTANHLAWINSFLSGNWSGLSLTHWTQNNYGYGAIFIRYLIDQYGDIVIKNMCSTDKVGIAAVEAATGEDFNIIFYNFMIALAVSGTGDITDTKFNFTTLNLQTIQPLDRKGLYAIYSLIAGDSAGDSTAPYEIYFIKGLGNFNTMTLTGTSVIGATLGLSQ